jgi:predicted nucleic acid-binding protein
MRIVRSARRTPRRALDDDLPPEATALRYIESSALVAAILERDAEALSDVREVGQRATSALTFAETVRALIRARAAGRISQREERSALRTFQRFARRCASIAVTEEILARAARPFPVEPIRTLDAIHLATIESMSDVPQLVTVVTRDDRIARNARALGYAVAPC